MKINGYEIKNTPDNTLDYVVARYVDGEYWYWMMFRDPASAFASASEVDGYVFSEKLTAPDIR